MCLLLLWLSGQLLGLAGYQQDPGKNMLRISQSCHNLVTYSQRRSLALEKFFRCLFLVVGSLMARFCFVRSWLLSTYFLKFLFCFVCNREYFFLTCKAPKVHCKYQFNYLEITGGGGRRWEDIKWSHFITRGIGEESRDGPNMIFETPLMGVGTKERRYGQNKIWQVLKYTNLFALNFYAFIYLIKMAEFYKCLENHVLSLLCCKILQH